MKNKISKIIIMVLCLLIISFGLSFILYNFDLLKLNKKDRIVNNISLSSLNCNGFNYSGKLVSQNSSKRNININYDGYINKLVIEYKTDQTFTFDIKYIGKDYYNKNINKENSDTFTKKLNTSVVSFKESVKDIDIDFSNGGTFEIKSIKIDNTIGFNFYLFIFVFLSISSFLIVFLYLKHNLFDGKIEKLFLSLALIFGFLFILLQPQFTGYSYDDQIHFSNIYRLFELDGVTEWTQSYHDFTEISPFGGGINTLEERVEQNKYLNNKNDIVLVEENSPFITYGQIGYIVPGFIFKVCNLIGIGNVLTIILTKFSMLLCYSLIMYYSIKIIHRGKRILSIFGLLPSVLFLSTQFSYDPPIIAFMCLFASQFISIMEDKNTSLGFKEAIVLLCSCIIPAFIKVVYAPLLLLILLIPKNKFLSDKHRKVFKIGAILIFLLLISTYIFPTATSSDLGDIRGGNTSVSGQVKTILKHPHGFISLLSNTAGNKLADKLMGSSTLYYYAYVNSAVLTGSFVNIYYSLLLLFVFVVITDSYRTKSYDSEKFVKLFNFIINIAMLLLIWVALYVSFSPVGSTDISGVQNRYFLPIIIPFILISFSTNKIKTSFNLKKYDSVIMLIISILLVISLYSVFFRNFCI